LTSETIFYSLSMTLRFIILMESFSLFFLTTIPDDLSLALEKMGIPHDFCFAFTSAIRFVPDLALEIQSIMDAQKSRGLELEKGSFMERIRNYIPILIPMLIRSFQRSLELAEAMESRAYGALKKRTSLYELKMVRSDYMATALIIIFLFTMLYVKFFIKLP
ncbi:energy-coupling factor transporter transmembrane protein EcfT, partial [Candidatus Bathyarchaeota archaeon]|nr:energy-coupling factor transporter transmembrane protein EcfT [Candidatus Bathyarchaeota archaeon]